ncbi:MULTISPECIES: acyl carrier protein [Streptomyces]|uniref:Acyl carrier protein n=1 Tax=Streptomyces fungicidicus TaxID=68203 RepID=A0ACC7XV19_9ACTN|nr:MULTISPECIES: acyl carrier protein [Streptomyces]MBF4132624.1 acyl carrier protein [Streptomyces albidoflavus]NUV73393.1 acyl carrier protein [Streptomyces fungicidicus]PAX86121.1 acyl carrier protein [Streptomyces albidoflavus]PAX88878.1 acyl carrier protein [Streptomyces albidoflavus]PBO16611.1 acyl carrier protein [Streptomyces albidoflavus]
MTETYTQLVSIVAGLHDASADHFRPETTYADLDVDSLTMVEISIHIERHLGVTVEDSELVPGLTLGATAELIEARLTA